MVKLKVESIHKSFKKHQVLRDLSFECEEEILFLAGRNGAGKTTLIRLALGMERADSGLIELLPDKGNDTVRVGAVFDSPCLYMDMTGQQNLNIFCTGFLEDSEYVHNVLHDLNIDDRFLRKRAREYSFGQQHRLSVAIALIRKPQILFLDEPTIGLDPVSWGLVRACIVNNRKLYKGCVIITGQDYSEMGTLADRILILEGGEAKYIGTPENLLSMFPKQILLKTKSDELPEEFRRFITKIETDESGNKIVRLTTGDETEDVFVRIKNSNIDISSLSIVETSYKDAFLSLIGE